MNSSSITAALSSQSAVAETQLVDSLIELSGKYSPAMLSPGDAFRSLKTFLPPYSSMMVSYEALIHVSPAYSGFSDRTGQLRSVLDFIGYPQIVQERLTCAYTFLEISEEEQSLLNMHNFFASRKSALCTITTNIMRNIGSFSFNFTRLYSHLEC